jgi:predicted TIM-barrel fold metal-dependent hydrolase
VARDFPDLKVGVAHAGRPFIEQTIALAVDPNVYVDVSWSQLALGLYPDALKTVLMAFGPDRIVYGSDTGTREGLVRPEDFVDVTTVRCERMFRETMRILGELNVDQASTRKIMGENARRLLKL